MLGFLALLDPGDEILVPDPYFTMYPVLSGMCSGVPVTYDLYPGHGADGRGELEAGTSASKHADHPAHQLAQQPHRPHVDRMTELRHGGSPWPRVTTWWSSPTRSTTAFVYDGPLRVGHRPCGSPTDCCSSAASARPTRCPAGAWAGRRGPERDHRRDAAHAAVLVRVRTLHRPEGRTQGRVRRGHERRDRGLPRQAQPHARRTGRPVRGRVPRRLLLHVPSPSPRAYDTDGFMAGRAGPPTCSLFPARHSVPRDAHFRLSFAATDDVLDRGIEALSRHRGDRAKVE